MEQVNTVEQIWIGLQFVVFGSDQHAMDRTHVDVCVLFAAIVHKFSVKLHVIQSKELIECTASQTHTRTHIHTQQQRKKIIRFRVTVLGPSSAIQGVILIALFGNLVYMNTPGDYADLKDGDSNDKYGDRFCYHYYSPKSKAIEYIIALHIFGTYNTHLTQYNISYIRSKYIINV